MSSKGSHHGSHRHHYPTSSYTTDRGGTSTTKEQSDYNDVETYEYKAEIGVNKPARRINLRLNRGPQIIRTTAAVLKKPRADYVYIPNEITPAAYKIVVNKKGQETVVPLTMPVSFSDLGYMFKVDRNGLMYVKSRKNPNWIHVVSPNGRILSHRIWSSKQKRWLYVSAKSSGYPHLDNILTIPEPDAEVLLPNGELVPAVPGTVLVEQSGQLLPTHTTCPSYCCNHPSYYHHPDGCCFAQHSYYHIPSHPTLPPCVTTAKQHGSCCHRNHCCNHQIPYRYIDSHGDLCTKYSTAWNLDGNTVVLHRENIKNRHNRYKHENRR